MITFIRKLEYHYVAFKSLYATEYGQGITFIAWGKFQLKGEQAFPFMIIGRMVGGQWSYKYFSKRRFTSSQMQTIRQAAKKLPATESSELPGQTPAEANANFHKTLRSLMTRIYVGRDEARAREMGAVFDPEVKGYFVPPHLDVADFNRWLVKPEANESTRAYAIKPGPPAVIVADPNENLTLAWAGGVLVNITRVGKPFETPEGIRAYHHFEVVG